MPHKSHLELLNFKYLIKKKLMKITFKPDTLPFTLKEIWHHKREVVHTLAKDLRLYESLTLHFLLRCNQIDHYFDSD